MPVDIRLGEKIGALLGRLFIELCNLWHLLLICLANRAPISASSSSYFRPNKAGVK